MTFRLQAAINGRRTRAAHPAIPTTPEELAAAAKGCTRSGAGAVHLHAWSRSGHESLDSVDVAAAVTAVRSAAPSVPVGVSTGAWILRDASLRHLTVARWQILPDFVSVNFGEEGAVDLAKSFLSRGVEVEAGLSNLIDARVLVSSDLAKHCLRLLIEPQDQDLQEALKTVEGIEQVIDQECERTPRLLHGVDATVWEFVDQAVARGYHARIGFEDTLTLPDGSRAATNAALVGAAAQRMKNEHTFG